MTGGVTAEGMGMQAVFGRKGEKTWSLQLCGVGPVTEQGAGSRDGKTGGRYKFGGTATFDVTGGAAFLEALSLTRHEGG